MPSLTTTQSAQACANRSSPKRSRSRSGSPSTTEKPTSTNTSLTSQASGFGILLLLLAALPYNEEGLDGALEGNGTSQSRPSLASTANLRFCASLEDVMRAGRSALEYDDMFDDDDDESEANSDESEEERRRRRKRKQIAAKKKAASRRRGGGITPLHADRSSMSYATTSSDDQEVSSQGNTDELNTGSFASIPSTAHADEITLSTLTDLGEECLAFAMGFLPLKDLSMCRRISKTFEAAAACDIPTPFSGSIFMRFGTTHRGASYAVPPTRNTLKWACNHCSTQNNVSYTHCRQCQGGNADCLGVRKVFLGQLRKERTTELADWILSRLYPEMQPLHIENHTGKDNRGKGCAWIYVTNAADEAKVLSLNKRMFVDVDDNGQEGVWLCDKTHSEELTNMATARAYKTKRPQVLPRQPLTAERPGARPQVSRGSSNMIGARSNSSWLSASNKNTHQNSPATAQELYEQYAAPIVATPVNATMAAIRSAQSPKPRSCQPPVGHYSQQHNYNNYQYQPNSINVFEYSAPGVPSTHPKSPYSSSTGANSWTHNPYGASVLSPEFAEHTQHYNAHQDTSFYHTPQHQQSHYGHYYHEDYSVSQNSEAAME